MTVGRHARHMSQGCSMLPAGSTAQAVRSFSSADLVIWVYRHCIFDPTHLLFRCVFCRRLGCSAMWMIVCRSQPLYPGCAMLLVQLQCSSLRWLRHCCHPAWWSLVPAGSGTGRGWRESWPQEVIRGVWTCCRASFDLFGGHKGGGKMRCNTCTRVCMYWQTR